jgi:RNA polymerase sigma factor (sigma-70 family)
MSHLSDGRVFLVTAAAMVKPTIQELVGRARAGDMDACAQLVEATQAMAYGAALGVLRDRAAAQDAVQQAYLRAFRRLDQLEAPEAFNAWLRRVVVSVALNMRRARRTTLLRLDETPDVPVLDETETRWSAEQRHRLAAALLTLSAADRQLCDRRYHGGWSTARLAANVGIDEAAMRKRLQRIRDKLRKEIEMAEQRDLRAEDLRADLPAAIVELLARPCLTNLPENPVGSVCEQVRSAFPEFALQSPPELVDLDAARRTIAGDLMYVDPVELHRVDDRRILRYDLTLPLLLSVRFEGQPLRLWASGKVYRQGRVDKQHLEAFHQAEVFWLDERARVDPWQVTARVLQSIDRVVPGRTVKIVPTQYPMCTQAWELEVEQDGEWSEVLAWGLFTDRIVRHLGGDPSVHAAAGVGYGLERLAMLRYGIDDIRKVDVTNVA